MTLIFFSLRSFSPPASSSADPGSSRWCLWECAGWEGREEEGKRGQLHLRLLRQVYHCLGALPRLVQPRTWNAPMRQSGAAGAWRLVAGRWGGEMCGHRRCWSSGRRPAEGRCSPRRRRRRHAFTGGTKAAERSRSLAVHIQRLTSRAGLTSPRCDSRNKRKKKREKI